MDQLAVTFLSFPFATLNYNPCQDWERKPGRVKFGIFRDGITASCNNSSKEDPAVGIYMKKTFATEEPWMLVCDTSTVILSLV